MRLVKKRLPQRRRRNPFAAGTIPGCRPVARCRLVPDESLWSASLRHPWRRRPAVSSLFVDACAGTRRVRRH